MVVERFENSDVTEAPDSAILSRFHCPEPFGKTNKSVLMPANDLFYSRVTFQTLRRNGSAEFSHPVAFPLPRTLRQD